MLINHVCIVCGGGERVQISICIHQQLLAHVSQKDEHHIDHYTKAKLVIIEEEFVLS